MNDEETRELDIILLSLTLDKQEEELVAERPTIFTDAYLDNLRAVALHHWPLILAAQLDKAKRGDTASAKFLTDLLEPLRDSGSVVPNSPLLEWEELAIELRNLLDIEISAETFVVLVLRALMDKPTEYTMELLGDKLIRIN